MLSLRSPVNQKDEQKECKYVEHVGVQFAVMHAGEESCYRIHSSPNGPQEDPVHDVGFFTLSMNRSPEVNCKPLLQNSEILIRPIDRKEQGFALL